MKVMKLGFDPIYIQLHAEHGVPWNFGLKIEFTELKRSMNGLIPETAADWLLVIRKRHHVEWTLTKDSK